MNKKTKGIQIQANRSTWPMYQDANLKRKDHLLCPVNIELTSDSANSLKFEMTRMRTQQLRGLKNKILSNVPAAQKSEIKRIIEHYIKFFATNDESESAVANSPLDFNGVKRSVIYLVYLNNNNLTFSGYKQFACKNDKPANPFTRQLAVFDAQRGILVLRSGGSKRRLKYDYYVTLHQAGGLATDMIIDPRDDDEVGGNN